MPMIADNVSGGIRPQTPPDPAAANVPPPDKAVHAETDRPRIPHRLRSAAARALMFAPLALLNPALGQIARRLAASRPGLFARMGPHARKTFVIDPIDLPVIFMLSPDTSAPGLRAVSRYDVPRHDGAIAGRFVHLLDMIDGSIDGDALFFSRALRVTGDTEAAVALRNALDDFDGDLVKEILGAFGPLAAPAGFVLRTVRALSAMGGSHG